MRPNAIVIMFDSLQFNYVGCYGNDWIKTPNMDRLAREGVLFENAYTEGLPTVPCRRAMHTGRYTVHHSGWCALTMEDTTIADLCWGRPIDTALVFDCPMYRLTKFGYTRGFDKVWFTHGHELDHYYFESDPLYHDRVERYFGRDSLVRARRHLGQGAVDISLEETRCYLTQAQYWTGPEDRYVAKTVRKAVEYLEQADRAKQFFLWVDSFDPHEPWNPPSVYLNTPCPYDPDYAGADEFNPFTGDAGELYTEPELRHIRMLYAELVTLCDEYLGVLLEAVRRLGLEESTLLMMVSDHGEPMGHGEHGHGIIRKCRPWPYEELVHVPLILRGPGLPAGIRISAFVQSCDVAPTVCDWLGIGVHPSMHGKSLLPLARGEVKKLRDFVVAGYYKGGISLITGEWSYIHWSAESRNSMEFMRDVNENVMAASSANLQVGGKDSINKIVSVDKLDGGSDAVSRLKAAATLDGADQWTCTPTSTFVMPAEDELYRRGEDPFQLRNVIAGHPDVAKEMLTQLRAFLDGLRAS